MKYGIAIICKRSLIGSEKGGFVAAKLTEKACIVSICLLSNSLPLRPLGSHLKLAVGGPTAAGSGYTLTPNPAWPPTEKGVGCNTIGR
jgi:hypothetical protein